MAWQKFVTALKKSPRKKKDPDELFSEPFLVKFNKIQIRFIVKQSGTYGSKANVVRQGLNLFIKEIERQGKQKDMQ